MGRRVALSVIAAILIASCGPSKRDCQDEDGIVSLVASADHFTTEELAHIERAVERWNAFAGRSVVRVARGVYRNWCSVIKGDEEPESWAKLISAYGRIVIDPVYRCKSDAPIGQDMRCFEAIAMHEMGHLMGLNHLPNGADGIMRGIGDTALEFTEADRRECMRADVCRDEH